MISILFLREKGFDLPVEIWHYDELSQNDVSRLSQMVNVNVKNMKEYIKQSLDRDGGKLFSMKAAILLYTSLEEVLFLDSDNIPAQNPLSLFDTPAYKETGTLFWPGNMV